MALTSEQQRVYEAVMARVRPVLKRRVGESPRAYDTADAVAYAVSAGVEAALPVHPDHPEHPDKQRARDGRSSDSVISEERAR